ncbi:hypothetical protein L1N82_16465 [Paenibacillus tarimensis]|nr:hypothetical protein [Paenibacillus tarimensis]
MALLLSGCYKYQESFTTEGKITSIDVTNQTIAVNHNTVYTGDHDITKLKQGQQVKITLIDTTSENDWDPSDYIVTEIVVVR